jgi:SAM-dependent methyltransferase
LEDAAQVLQGFWDRWHQDPIEQYVACDFSYVAQSLLQIQESGLAEGNLFCEWGCGFGVVTGLAAMLGWEAIGIEAEEFLVREAKRLLERHCIAAQIVQGNFLPAGAQGLADLQADHPSLFHQLPSAYQDLDLDVDDFALVFAYPWPGEEHFQREVFRVHARSQALLLMFRGPYHIELFRKA